MRKLKVRNLWLQDGDNYAVDVTEKILNLYNGTVGSLVLDQEDDAATPTLAFGDGDTGFYEKADDNIYVAIAGNERWRISDGMMGYSTSISGTRPALLNLAASATQPTIIPAYGNDSDTGIGSAG